MTRIIPVLKLNSLRGQLLLWLLGPLLLIGLYAIYDGYREARLTADTVSDRVLSGSALAIAERVFVNSDNKLEVDIPYVALQMLTTSEDDRVFYRIEDAEGTFITGYRGLNLPISKPDATAVTFQNGSFRGAPIRIATYRGAASSNTRSLGFRVGIAETTNARSAIAHSILVRSSLRQGLSLIGAAILVWFAVTRVLRPLHRVEEAVGRRSPEDVRPIEHKVPSEVSGLVFTINELVKRFASSISALQNFTSNASHQFRTPLALIKTHLEVASRETDARKQREAIQKAHVAVGDAERLMSQMLLLARLDATSREELKAKKCDLAAIVRDVCEDFVLQMSNEGRSDVDLGFEAEHQFDICADSTLTQEVVRNLIDNAIKHSGEKPKIDVLVHRNAERGFVEVRDNGEGFSLPRHQKNPEDWSESKNDIAGNGNGLGLSIVQEILDLVDGELAARALKSRKGMIISASFRLSIGT